MVSYAAKTSQKCMIATLPCQSMLLYLHSSTRRKYNYTIHAEQLCLDFRGACPDDEEQARIPSIHSTVAAAAVADNCSHFLAIYTHARNDHACYNENSAHFVQHTNLLRVDENSFCNHSLELIVVSRNLCPAGMVDGFRTADCSQIFPTLDDDSPNDRPTIDDQRLMTRTVRDWVSKSRFFLVGFLRRRRRSGLTARRLMTSSSS